MTPLLMAVENGHFELAINLVKAGADPNDLRGGYTALHNITWVRKPDHGEGEDGQPRRLAPEVSIRCVSCGRLWHWERT